MTAVECSSAVLLSAHIMPPPDSAVLFDKALSLQHRYMRLQSLLLHQQARSAAWLFTPNLGPIFRPATPDGCMAVTPNTNCASNIHNYLTGCGSPDYCRAIMLETHSTPTSCSHIGVEAAVQHCHLQNESKAAVQHCHLQDEGFQQRGSRPTF